MDGFDICNSSMSIKPVDDECCNSETQFKFKIDQELYIDFTRFPEWLMVEFSKFYFKDTQVYINKFGKIGVYNIFEPCNGECHDLFKDLMGNIKEEIREKLVDMSKMCFREGFYDSESAVEARAALEYLKKDLCALVSLIDDGFNCSKDDSNGSLLAVFKKYGC